ncbi:hypothetical protein EXS72_01705 [Candidatus Pacearchaeota archaeon]|nr:hypothetical protein [Candidatus Pacearchaeota archaeon]
MVDVSLRDKMLSSFIVGVGFWLINISHGSYLESVTALISGIAFIFLLIYSFQAIRKGDKVGWAYFATVVWMILSYLRLNSPYFLSKLN